VDSENSIRLPALKRKKNFADSQELFLLYKQFYSELSAIIPNSQTAEKIEIPFLEKDPLNYIEKNSDRILILYTKVYENGGFYNITANNDWEKIGILSSYKSYFLKIMKKI